MNHKLTIFLDYDDVIVDWCTPACNTFDLDLTDPDVRHQIENNWGGIDKWVPDDKLWGEIHRVGAGWWEALPLLPWANRLYSEMSRLGEVCFLTAPSDDPSCAAGKVASIKKHFDTRNYLIGKPKYLCASKRSILVDDRPSNCEKFVEYGGQAFQWPNAVKLQRLGRGEEMVDQLINFTKGCYHHLECNSNFSSHCIPELVDVE